MAPVNCVVDGDNNVEEYIIKAPDLDYTPDARGMGFAFYNEMINNSEKIAQIDGVTGEKDTYGELLQRCIRTAMNMRLRGINPEDVVSTCSFNHLNSTIPFIATMFLGAKSANLDPSISLEDTVQLIEQVSPKMIFVCSDAVNLIENAVRNLNLDTEIVVFEDQEIHSSFADFLVPVDGEEEFEPVNVVDPKTTGLIFFSSGTTGLAKGICVNHVAMLSQGYNLAHLGVNIELILAFSSIYWISSCLFLTTTILAGTCRLIFPRYDVNFVWQLTEIYKVTLLFLAPSQIVAMYKKGRPDEINTTSLSDVIVGGGPISKEQIVQIRDIFPGTNVSSAYGQTEIAGSITLFNPSIAKHMIQLYENPGSCGKPIPGVWYKIVDPETETVLGPNEPGELRIKSLFVMNGYYDRDSSESWDSDGWLKTGDVAYYNDDQCFFIVDRIKDMLKFQSWHVAPAMLEGVLQTHPAVQGAIVVGLPDEEDGDHPIGLVVLSSSAGDVTPEEIEQYVEERVQDRQRLRGGVRFIDHIPLTPTGKLMRRTVRDMILRGEI